MAAKHMASLKQHLTINRPRRGLGPPNWAWPIEQEQSKNRALQQKLTADEKERNMRALPSPWRACCLCPTKKVISQVRNCPTSTTLP
jgi:hypothetical protein